MGTDYTPAVEQVRRYWASEGNEQPAAKSYEYSEGLAEFDRFIAKIKSDALREAADDADEITGDGHGGGEWFPSEWAGQVAGWLEHRADRIEEEA